jgi:hypothetical protein
MSKPPKFPFLARTKTNFNGQAYYRCLTLESAISRAKAERDPAPDVRIVERYVTDTKGNVLCVIEPNERGLATAPEDSEPN